VNELALFAGAGGGILGGHLLGWRTVCAVEWEQYPASVLCARQNDGLLPSFPIWDDVQTFDGKPWQGIVDVVSGGFPCQDISAAGRGGGIEAERSGMWKEMARIIGEVRPKYAFVENSPMLTSRGLGTVLRDLAQMGFDAEWGVLSAADVGANHKRERIWILAYSNSDSDFWSESKSNGIQNETKGISGTQYSSTWQSSGTSDLLRKDAMQGYEKSNMAYTSFQPISNKSNSRGDIGFNEQQGKGSRNINGSGSQKNVSNASSIRQQGQGKHEQSINSTKNCQRQTNYAESIGRSEFWSVEPPLGRVANGVAARLDRLKAIGNGQVPLCAATAWKLLSERLDEQKQRGMA
jgi:DNA (cytosine-5)-methyltransferase 1